MLTAILFLAVCFLAWSNGANDNFKGVASLFGSRTCSYRTAINWATIATAAGSVAAIFVAHGLLKKFSGKGLVPDDLVASPHFVLAVAIGAGGTVMLATLTGFPISTTHGLTGALVGAGMAAVGSQVSFATLQKSFVFPLLFSPVLALACGAVVYAVLRFIRLKSGVTKELCVRIGEDLKALSMSQPAGVFDAQVLPEISVTSDKPSAHAQRYVGSVAGFQAGRLVNGLHFLSAGAVSFARGLNDTPKIAALLLVAGSLDIRWGLLAVAAAMAAGGLLNAKKVAETMSHKITDLNPGQGLAANLSTAALVTSASFHGLPVSTTHVSVGALLGIGVISKQAKWRSVLAILLSWVVTLPCAAALAAIAFTLLGR